MNNNQLPSVPQKTRQADLRGYLVTQSNNAIPGYIPPRNFWEAGLQIPP